MAYRDNNSIPGNFTHTSAVSGATEILTVSNTSNTASSQAQTSITVAGTTAGDAFTTYTVTGTTNWSVGVDNSATVPSIDPFVIAASTALGTTNVMSIGTGGQITKPLNPCFLAYPSADLSNVTGDGTVYQVALNAEQFDVNSNYNTGTFTFVCPVAGKYWFGANLQLSGLLVTHTQATLYVQNSTAGKYGFLYNANPFTQAATGAGINIINGSTIMDCAASDSIVLVLAIYNGTKVVDITQNGATDPRSWFTGYFVG